MEYFEHSWVENEKEKKNRKLHLKERMRKVEFSHATYYQLCEWVVELLLKATRPNDHYDRYDSDNNKH